MTICDLTPDMLCRQVKPGPYSEVGYQLWKRQHAKRQQNLLAWRASASTNDAARSMRLRLQTAFRAVQLSTVIPAPLASWTSPVIICWMGCPLDCFIENEVLETLLHIDALVFPFRIGYHTKNWTFGLISRGPAHNDEFCAPSYHMALGRCWWCQFPRITTPNPIDV